MKNICVYILWVLSWMEEKIELGGRKNWVGRKNWAWNWPILNFLKSLWSEVHLGFFGNFRNYWQRTSLSTETFILSKQHTVHCSIGLSDCLPQKKWTAEPNLPRIEWKGALSNVKSSCQTLQCHKSVDLSPHFWACTRPLWDSLRPDLKVHFENRLGLNTFQVRLVSNFDGREPSSYMGISSHHHFVSILNHCKSPSCTRGQE